MRYIIISICIMSVTAQCQDASGFGRDHEETIVRNLDHATTIKQELDAARDVSWSIYELLPGVNQQFHVRKDALHDFCTRYCPAQHNELNDIVLHVGCNPSVQIGSKTVDFRQPHALRSKHHRIKEYILAAFIAGEESPHEKHNTHMLPLYQKSNHTTSCMIDRAHALRSIAEMKKWLSDTGHALGSIADIIRQLSDGGIDTQHASLPYNQELEIPDQISYTLAKAERLQQELRAHLHVDPHENETPLEGYIRRSQERMNINVDTHTSVPWQTYYNRVNRESMQIATICNISLKNLPWKAHVMLDDTPSEEHMTDATQQ